LRKNGNWKMSAIKDFPSLQAHDQVRLLKRLVEKIQIVDPKTHQRRAYSKRDFNLEVSRIRTHELLLVDAVKTINLLPSPWVTTWKANCVGNEVSESDLFVSFHSVIKFNE